MPNHYQKCQTTPEGVVVGTKHGKLLLRAKDKICQTIP